MMPMWQNHNDLSIFDIKLKKDRKSYEYNLGLVYRHNFDDKWILGIYSYFDRRRTEHKLEANQWTFGTEALSNFFDVRVNAYLPENKKRTIYTKPREFRRDHTAIYALSEGKFQEHTLPGYDIEVGIPFFGLFPKMDDKFGTKIYAAKYDFTRKNVARNSGLRFRLEQKLFEDKLSNSSFKLTMHVGTHYTNSKKWDNFVGLSIRVPLSKDQPRRTKMQERMMDTVVRDVDIRTEKRISQPREPLHLKGKQIDHVYFVAEGSCGGDGSSGNPYCIAEYQTQLKNTKPGFMIMPIGHFTEEGYNSVMDHPDAIDHVTHDVVLATTDSDAIFSVKDYFPELRLVKSQDEEVHTYSAVMSIHPSEQIVPEKYAHGNEDLYYSYLQEDIDPEYIYKADLESLYETDKVSSQSEQRTQKPVAAQNLARTKEEHEGPRLQDILSPNESDDEVFEIMANNFAATLAHEGNQEIVEVNTAPKNVAMRWLEQIDPTKLSHYARYLHSHLISKKTNAKVMHNLIKTYRLRPLPENNTPQLQQHNSTLEPSKMRPLKMFALNTPANAQVAREFLSKQPKAAHVQGAENNAPTATKPQTKPLIIRAFDTTIRPIRMR